MQKRIGVLIQAASAADSVDLIVEAERVGVRAVWQTMGGVSPDPLTTFAAASQHTDRILLGTSIVPTWPRHPLALAQQVLALEGLAPGRVRLGVGPSTEAAMRSFGVDFGTPLDELREFPTVLRSFLHDGDVDFEGDFVQAHARTRAPTQTPLFASALQPAAFRLCGELTDGAISWVCPRSYLVEQALPALREGAELAGREAPPLVMHVPVCVEEDPGAVREAAQRAVGMYARFQFYRDMYARAGYPEAGERLSEALVDDLVVSGDEQTVANRLLELLDAGMGELLVMPLATGDDREGSRARAFGAITRATAALES